MNSDHSKVRNASKQRRGASLTAQHTPVSVIADNMKSVCSTFICILLYDLVPPRSHWPRIASLLISLPIFFNPAHSHLLRLASCFLPQPFGDQCLPTNWEGKRLNRDWTPHRECSSARETQPLALCALGWPSVLGQLWLAPGCSVLGLLHWWCEG